MVALKLIAYVAFGVLFLSISFTLILGYQQAEAERRFLNQAQELADLVDVVGDQDVGASQNFPTTITVPSNSQLLFENDSVVAKIRGRRENFSVETFVIGSTLGEGSFQLKLLRTQEGVEISAT